MKFLCGILLVLMGHSAFARDTNTGTFVTVRPINPEKLAVDQLAHSVDEFVKMADSIREMVRSSPNDPKILEVYSEMQRRAENLGISSGTGGVSGIVFKKIEAQLQSVKPLVDVRETHSTQSMIGDNYSKKVIKNADSSVKTLLESVNDRLVEHEKLLSEGFTSVEATNQLATKSGLVGFKGRYESLEFNYDHVWTKAEARDRIDEDLKLAQEARKVKKTKDLGLKLKRSEGLFSSLKNARPGTFSTFKFIPDGQRLAVFQRALEDSNLTKHLPQKGHVSGIVEKMNAAAKLKAISRRSSKPIKP